jgi:hypothetical protein
LADAHVVLALAAALVVWPALGLSVGEHMRLPLHWGGWLSLLLVQPITEELVFRGVLQGELLRLTAHRRAGPLTWANLLASAGFVGLHLLAQPPGWAWAVLVPSLVFGHLRDRLGSVLPAVFMHVAYNLGFGITAWCIQR